MKHGVWIGFVVAMLMAGCSSFPSSSGLLATTDPTLASIDSLLWTQPDSAFAQLQAFAESREVDSLNTFNRHYFHLLLSELLYKNDYAQTNRDELLKAVDYYDSLVDVCGKRVHPDLVFLDARAHYIDGAGYYEMDSAVSAGDIWKIGETTQIAGGRYSEKLLNSIGTGGVQQYPVLFGNQREIKMYEKYMIYGYYLKYGHLPPGNKIFR